MQTHIYYLRLTTQEADGIEKSIKICYKVSNNRMQSLH